MAVAGLERVGELIDAQYTRPLDLDELACAAHFSRYHFLRAFAACIMRRRTNTSRASASNAPKSYWQAVN